MQEESASHDARMLRIAAFPPGPSVWRIDWFGPIAFPDRMLRRRHPSVLVYLSKVVHPQALANPAVLLQPDCTLPTDQQIKRWVSVGTTMLLRIGDLWQDQTLLARPAYEQFLADDVQVDRDTVTIVKAGSSFDDGSFLLPLTEHPWHRANTHSYCVRLALPGNRFLVVPCMEMARFYFGSSSELLSRLFQPPLTKDRLFTKVSTDARGRMWLDLAERLPRASAEDVARIAGSDIAWKAATLISVSCLKASTAGKEAFPQAVFPFEGSSDLQAVGKWLSGGQEHAGTFLAYQLQTCSHAFPFRWLRVKVPGSCVHGTQPQDHARGRSSSLPKTTAGLPKNPTLQERDPSAQLAATTQPVHGRRRFPDLDRKPVTMTRLLTRRAAKGGMHQVRAVEDLAIGEAASTERIRSLGLVDGIDLDKPLPPPDFLHSVINAVQQLEGIGVQLLTANENDGWTLEQATWMVDEDGVINEELMRLEAGSRSRRTGAFLLSAKGKYVLLVAVESNPIVLYPVDANASEKFWRVVPGALEKSIVEPTLCCKSSGLKESFMNCDGDYLKCFSPRSTRLLELIRRAFSLSGNGVHFEGRG